MNTNTFPFVIEDDNGEPVLSVTMRQPTIEDQFAFRAALNSGLSDATTKILNTCTVSAEDPGPWLAKADADDNDPACGVDWARVTSGIRMRALFALKINSKKKGHLIDVDMLCPECEKEDAGFTAVVDARPIPDGELLWYEPEDINAVVEAIVTNSPLMSSVGGVEIGIKPPSGTLEASAERFMKNARKPKVSLDEIKNQASLYGMALRLASVDGVHVNDHQRWVKQLTEDDYDELEAATDATDWGVELTFEATCPRGHLLAGEVPFVYLFGRPNTAMKALRQRQRKRAHSKKRRPASQE